MSRNRSRRRNKRARRDAARLSKNCGDAAQLPTLTALLREALSSGDPLYFLAMVSFGLGKTMPDPFDIRHDKPEVLNLGNIVSNAIAEDSPEMTAFLAVVAELVDDDEQQAHCRRAIADRSDELPKWLLRLGDLDIYRAVHRTHVLGDYSELLIGARLADRTELTCIVHFAHSSYLEITDAGFLSESISSIITTVTQELEHPDFTHVELSLADARAWIDEGFGERETLFLPNSTAWPEFRALMHWFLRKLPDGGARGEAPTWTSHDILMLLRECFAPLPERPRGRIHAIYVLAELCEDSGTGDPLRWSAARIREVLDADTSEDDEFDGDRPFELPELLRVFVPFAHAQAGIRQGLTDRALAAIDEYGPVYQAAG